MSKSRQDAPLFGAGTTIPKDSVITYDEQVGPTIIEADNSNDIINKLQQLTVDHTQQIKVTNKQPGFFISMTSISTGDDELEKAKTDARIFIKGLGK